MAFVHGKDTYISVNGVDLSPYTKTSELSHEADIHDVTTYGKTRKVKKGGLIDGTGSLSGVYDSTAVTGPRAALLSIVGSTVTLVRRPEGTGAGKPQDSVSVVVKKYTETNPVDDMIAWACDLEMSDTLTSTTQ